MKISIIIPIYNVQDYLVDCIESVLNQTYTNLEIILVDDGSPDTCPQICDDFAKKDNRIKVIHKSNGGLSDARNIGLQNSTGDYVYFLDSDDIIYEDAIENLAKLTEKYPNVDLIYGRTVLQFEDNFNNYYQVDLSKYKSYYTNEEAKEALLFILPAIACNKLVKRSLVLDNDLYFTVGLLHEDELWRWTIRNYIHSCAICNKDTYWYRQDNQNSIMRAKDSTSSLISKVRIIEMMLETFDLKDKNDLKYILRFSSPSFKFDIWDECHNKKIVADEIKHLMIIQSNISMPIYIRLLIILWNAPKWIYNNKIVSTLLYKYGVWWQKYYLSRK